MEDRKMKFKSLIIGAIVLLTSSLVFADGHINLDGPGSLPLNPEEGQCFVHKFYPPEYSSTEQDVLIKEEYTYYTATPPVLGTEQIFHVFALPTVYEVIDPEFAQETVTIQIKPDDPVWHVKCCEHKKRCGHGKCPWPRGEHDHDVDLGDNLMAHDGNKCGNKCGHKKNKPCEQACFKAVKPVYKSYIVQRTVTDGSYETNSGASDVHTFEVPIVVEEATITEHFVPAEFATFTVYTLDHPGYMKWVEGTCKQYTCDPMVLQRALADKGYYSGPIDGIIGPNTINAMNTFRADNGLGIHDEMDKATADALGIKQK